MHLSNGSEGHQARNTIAGSGSGIGHAASEVNYSSKLEHVEGCAMLKDSEQGPVQESQHTAIKFFCLKNSSLYVTGFYLEQTLDVDTSNYYTI